MKQRKVILFLVLIAITVGSGVIYSTVLRKNRSESPKESSKSNTSQLVDESYYLSGFPKDKVPLYKATAVSSMKFFINDDPQNIADYFGSKMRYYNVVFKSSAPRNELLAYYKGMLDYLVEETYDESRVEGSIGVYKISINHYDSDQTAYLRVYVPFEQYSPVNEYFTDFPASLVAIQPEWELHESSFGFLKQLNGQIEYTQYYSIDEKLAETYAADYQQKYRAKDDYAYADNTLRWNENGYSVSVDFSKDHGRVYMMLRKAK